MATQSDWELVDKKENPIVDDLAIIKYEIILRSRNYF